MVGWLRIDNKTISVQSNLTGTAIGTELGNIQITDHNKLGEGCAKLTQNSDDKLGESCAKLKQNK